MDLRKFLKTQTVFLDLQANNLAEIMEVLLENMVNNNMVSYDKCADIMNAVLQDHTHQFEGLKKVSFKDQSYDGPQSKSTKSLGGQKEGVGSETGVLLNQVSRLSEFG